MQLYTWYESGRTNRSPGEISDGIIRLGLGGATAFGRTTLAHVKDPASGLYVKAPINQEKYESRGLLFEDARGDGIARNSFADGLTGWTSSGTGVNGSAISLDTVDVLFDPLRSSIPNSIKFLGANPSSGTACRIESTATGTQTAATKSTVTFHYRDNTGAPSAYWIKRNADNAWYIESSNTWGSETANPLTLSTSWGSYTTKYFTVGVDSALTVYFGIPGGGTAGQVNHLGHVQYNALSWPTSPIVTTSTSIVGDTDHYTVENNSGKRIWPRHGTFGFKFVPQWATADLAAAGAATAMAQVYHDANNEAYVWYNHGSSSWQFVAIIAGNTYTASKSYTASRLTPVSVTARWTSGIGELGLSPYTMSILVDGVKGTDAVPGAFFAEQATSTFRLGRRAAYASAWGWIYDAYITPLVLPDGRIG